MRKKKDLPLIILKSLEQYVNLEGEKFEVIDPKENLLKVIDKDVDSIFHFTIEKYQKISNGTFQLYINRIPKNTTDNGVYQAWIDNSALNSQFESWIKLLKDYDNVKSFYDDPITKAFQDEFYSEFEIIDEDADVNPFSIRQILILDNYLEKVDNRLNEFITEENSNEITEIKSEINSLKNNLTTKSKKWVIHRLTTIWAKIAKQGTKFIKEFLTESKKELIKQSVKGLLEFVKENGADLLS